jgi:hypothetical protein
LTTQTLAWSLVYKSAMANAMPTPKNTWFTRLESGAWMPVTR